MERIAVVGAGAMGGLWATRIADAGYQVSIVDASDEVVSAVRERGLVVVEKDGSTVAAWAQATTDPEGAGVQDIVFVFVKGPHTEVVAQAMQPLLGPDTIVATLQNGWGNADVLAGAVDVQRLVAGVTYHGALVEAPGRIRHPSSGPSFVGPFLDGGATDATDAVAEVMNAAGLECTSDPEVKTAIWRKLIHNAACLPVSALTGLRAAALVEPRPWRDVIDDLAREATGVARALGHNIDADERIEAIHAVLGAAGMGVPSMLADALARRPTEIATINGAIVRAGAGSGVAVPLNAAMVELVSGLERSWADAGV